MKDETMFFEISEKDKKLKDNIRIVYQSLEEKGYNPINQIIGYILSGDPTYITIHNNARKIIQEINRDEFLQDMVQQFFNGDRV